MRTSKQHWVCDCENKYIQSEDTEICGACGLKRKQGRAASLLAVRLGYQLADPGALFQIGLPENPTTSDHLCPWILLAKAIYSINTLVFNPTVPALCITDSCRFWVGDMETGTCPFERITAWPPAP